MFNIIIKESKEFIREKSSLFFFIMFPVILVFLLGNLLDESDIAESAIGTVQIDYIIDTQDPDQIASIDSFMSGSTEKEIISFHRSFEMASMRYG